MRGTRVPNSTETEAKPTGWTLDAPAATTLVRCARHTTVDATLLCQLCGAHWCRLCVAVGDERGVVWRRCQCGGRCDALAVEAPPATAHDFGAELLDALRYPFAGAARVQIAFGSCMFGFLSSLFGGSLASALPLIGLSPGSVNGGAVSVLGFGTALGAAIALLAVAGYLFAYVELVIAWTVKGRAEPPGFPDFVSIAESMFAPLLRLLVLLLIAFGPGVVLFALLHGFAALLGVVVLLAGLAYFPMALLAVAILESEQGFDPRRVIASIRVVPRQYALAATLFAVTFALMLGSGFAPIDLPYAGCFLRGAAIFALATIAGRVLGLTYLRFAKQLAWI